MVRAANTRSVPRRPLLLAGLAMTSVLLGQPPGLAPAAASSATAALPPSITVTERVHLGVTPARAWHAVEDFMAWPAWHTGFGSTQTLKGNGHSPGSVRLLIASDGTRSTDELLRFDGASHGLQFRTLRSALPLTDCVSTLMVLPHRSGSIVVLSATFRPQPQAKESDLRSAVAQLQRRGLDNLATAFD